MGFKASKIDEFQNFQIYCLQSAKIIGLKSFKLMGGLKILEWKIAKARYQNVEVNILL